MCEGHDKDDNDDNQREDELHLHGGEGISHNLPKTTRDEWCRLHLTGNFIFSSCDKYPEVSFII